MSDSDRALGYLKWPSLFCPQSNYEANEHVTLAKAKTAHKEMIAKGKQQSIKFTSAERHHLTQLYEGIMWYKVGVCETLNTKMTLFALLNYQPPHYHGP
ncbi:hypothetical protein pdam_00010699 [Pocillopora damicornis]|uniref:Uncharacterized protein n=1 Tax=Pocillopora damicornis TaxID=46731 RepID=A0A3M6T6X4_POCDA|nr:hypothetical protein pdam_00010699 [Pocillopora damicornis]